MRKKKGKGESPRCKGDRWEEIQPELPLSVYSTVPYITKRKVYG